MPVPSAKPDPPDVNQCQAESLSSSFMTLGPRKMVRCTNKPIWIATEVKPGEDGEIGNMSLCDACSIIMIDKLGLDYATFKRINL